MAGEFLVQTVDATYEILTETVDLQVEPMQTVSELDDRVPEAGHPAAVFFHPALQIRETFFDSRHAAGGSSR